MLRDLTVRESQCCSFFTFTVDRDVDAVDVEVEVPAAQATVLEALVGRALSRAGVASRR